MTPMHHSGPGSLLRVHDLQYVAFITANTIPPSAIGMGMYPNGKLCSFKKYKAADEPMVAQQEIMAVMSVRCWASSADKGAD